MIKYKKIFFIITLIGIIFVILPNVIGTYLMPMYYHTHQKIQYVREKIVVNKNFQKVQLEVLISIDPEVYNLTEWITFDFSPIFNPNDIIDESNYEVYIRERKKAKSSVFIPSKKAEYEIVKKSDNLLTFNVSIVSLESGDEIIFNANYTFRNRVWKTGEYHYAFFYINMIKSENHFLYFVFLHNYEIKSKTVDGEWKYGSLYQTFHVDKNELDKTIHFTFEDRNEKKSLEIQEKNRNLIINILFLVLGALLGLVLQIFWEKHKKRDKIFGNIDLKEFKDYKRAVIKIFKK
ncbi:hypothetical protein JXB41_08950 [Candidatus Woesearchaeota archaeon]|nr:hypothetical protein [Candidatus Woesearchaeota archaeon]